MVVELGTFYFMPVFLFDFLGSQQEMNQLVEIFEVNEWIPFSKNADDKGGGGGGGEKKSKRRQKMEELMSKKKRL